MLVACSITSDSGKDSKKKARKKLAGREKLSPVSSLLFPCLHFLNSADLEQAKMMDVRAVLLQIITI